MSRILEERVWAAAPLSLADRCVLLAVARGVPDGATEIHVNRTAMAEGLQARPEQVLHGLRAGEAVGLCRLYPSKGLVAFSAYDAPLGAPPRPAPRAAVAAAAPDDTRVATPRPTPQHLLNEFGRQWSRRYGQQYVQTSGKDHRLAAGLLRTLPPPEIARRIAAYLASDDPYYERCAHAFSVFASRVNEFIDRRPAVARRGVPDADATKQMLQRQREAR